MLSISGAVFLFACLGSGGVPGLQWIRNPFASLALLAAGILVNLGLGVLGRKQYFASFHTLLSLLALFIIPPASTTLFIAAVICLFAVIQTYNGRWDLHLILTISGFFAYHLFWIYTLQAEGFHEILRIQGVLVASVIFAVAALVHYRKSYGSERFELFPFLVHLANWFYFTFAMILYVGEYQWRTVPLILAALAAYLLSEKARDREIIWLRMTDIMICQILTVTALLTLLGWEMRPVMIGGLIFAETVLFSRIMVRQKILSLFRIGINLNYAATLALVVLSLANPGYAAAVITGGACFLALYMHHTLYAREDSLWIEGDRLFFIKKRGRNFPLTGLAAGLFALTVQIISTSMIEIPLTGGYPLAALFGIILLYVQSRETSRSMTAGALLFLALFGLTGWDKLLQATIYWRLDTADQLITGGSLLATGGGRLRVAEKLFRAETDGDAGNRIPLPDSGHSLLCPSHSLFPTISPVSCGFWWFSSPLFTNPFMTA